MKKRIGYRIFACFFYLFRLTGIRARRVFCVMTHDSSPESGVGVVVEALKARGGYTFYRITREQREQASRNVMSQFFSFFIGNAYHLATAEYVLMDNIFLPMAYLRFSHRTKVVQLWHGTGTVKKFGQSVNTGGLAKLEYRANQCVTHLIVNSEYTKYQYQEAFGIELDRIYVWGLPRTDRMFSEEKRNKSLQQFYEAYPELKGQKLILYAPTFRDDCLDTPSLALDGRIVNEQLPEGTTLLYRFHPHVAKAYEEALTLSGCERMKSVSLYPDLNTLLFASDLLITDYSSILFEYSVLRRPMLFYAYDLDQFEQNGRGFYEDYAEYVPGKVVHTTEELMKEIQILQTQPEAYQQACKRAEAFLDQSFMYQDGEATKRLLEHLFYES